VYCIHSTCSECLFSIKIAMQEISDESFEVVSVIQELVGNDCCRKCILNSKGFIEPSLKFLFNLICEVYYDSFQIQKPIWLMTVSPRCA